MYVQAFSCNAERGMWPKAFSRPFILGFICPFRASFYSSTCTTQYDLRSIDLFNVFTQLRERYLFVWTSWQIFSVKSHKLKQTTNCSYIFWKAGSPDNFIWKIWKAQFFLDYTVHHTLKTHAHLPLWTHVHKSYPYKHLWRLSRQILEIDEVMTCASLESSVLWILVAF